MGAAVWPLAAGLAFLRAGIVDRPYVDMAAFGGIAVSMVILATGFRPGLLVGSSIRRGGKVVPGLLVRKVLGWLSLIPSVLMAIAYVGGLDKL